METSEIKRTLQQLRPIIGNKVNKLWRLYQSSSTPQEKAERARFIKLLADKHLNTFNPEQINLIPPDKPKHTDYKIGTILYGKDYHEVGDFCLTDSDWMRHIGVFGSTGSGKTTVVYNLLKQLIDNDRPFLILDWKRDYRDLLKIPEFRDKILVFTVGKDVSPFRFNPKHKPPGVEDYVWEKKLIEIINQAYLLGPGAEDVIRENFSHDTFSEMQEHLLKQKKKARELLWWASAKRTLNAINFKGLSEVVNTDIFNLPDILNRQVVLELDGISSTDKVFLIRCLLQWIYYYRMAQPEREKWKHTIFLEEAHHLLIKQSQSRQENFAETLMREVRVFGQSMVVIDQRPSKLSDSALANINTKICLNLNHSTDVAAMQKALLLNNEQKDYIGMLHIGYSIIKNHRITFPFLARLPDFPIAKGIVTDNDIEDHMKRFPEFSRENKPTIVKTSSLRSLRDDEISLSPLGKIMLQNIAEQPFLPISKRYKMLGLTNAQGNDIQKELSDNGFVVPHTIDSFKLLELTSLARDMMNKWGLKARSSVRGSLEHNYWVFKVKDILKRSGKFTFTEKDNIDLVAISLQDEDSETIAVQVETGKSNLKKNIETLKNYESDRKLVLATNRQAEVKLKELNDSTDIDVMFVKDFIRKNPSI